jgi:hypothetical protein
MQPWASLSGNEELEPAIPTAGLEEPGFAGKFGVKLGKTPKYTD